MCREMDVLSVSENINPADQARSPISRLSDADSVSRKSYTDSTVSLIAVKPNGILDCVITTRGQRFGEIETQPLIRPEERLPLPDDGDHIYKVEMGAMELGRIHDAAVEIGASQVTVRLCVVNSPADGSHTNVMDWLGTHDQISFLKRFTTTVRTGQDGKAEIVEPTKVSRLSLLCRDLGDAERGDGEYLVVTMGTETISARHLLSSTVTMSFTKTRCAWGLC